jgi:hypothetical protein
VIARDPEGVLRTLPGVPIRKVKKEIRACDGSQKRKVFDTVLDQCGSSIIGVSKCGAQGANLDIPGCVALTARGRNLARPTAA